MADIDPLDELLRPSRWDKTRCTIAQALQEIGDTKQRDRMTTACDDNRISTRQVSEAFKHLLGDTLAIPTIRRHRIRGCGCA